MIGKSVSFSTAGGPVCPGRLHTRRCSQYFGNSAPFIRRSSSQQHRRHILVTRAEGSIKEGDLVSSEDEFFKKVTKHSGPIIVDWMAKWCRKCIYLKPKLEKMINEEFPGMDVVFIDVNAVPGGLVQGHGIKKMPTITLFKDGEKLREHVAAEQAPRAISIVKMMVTEYLDLNPEDKKLAMAKK